MTELFKRPANSITGGTPNGMPDYKPFNKLPRAEQDEVLKKVLRPTLYQVLVEDCKTGNSLAVGPKVPQNVASALAHTINVQVALGQEKLWHSAIVSPCI